MVKYCILIIRIIAWALFFGIGSFIFISCTSTKSHEPKTAEQVFNEAMALFNKEDYQEAEKLFETIRLQYPASQYADDAQFYLGESNFKRKEFIYAAYNYNMLRRIYPQSDFAKESLYKASLCYNELSPPYDRDLEYTKKAIQSFSEFRTIYPQDSLAPKATDYIKELREKLAHREYFTAVLYHKLYSPVSALIYFDTVIDNYSDTKYYEPAVYGKIETLYDMKRYDSAQSLVELYKKLFPNGTNFDKVNSLEQSIKNSNLAK
jgi:outer membrane protein assembly factor BamD